MDSLMRSLRPSTSVIIGETRRGETISEFKSADGKTVRVLNRGVYRQASAAAGKKLREITGGLLNGPPYAADGISAKHSDSSSEISGSRAVPMGVRRR